MYIRSLKVTGTLVVLLFFVAVPALAQVKPEPGQRYLLLATSKTATMLKELNEASALGFRVVTGGATVRSSEMVILMEKVAEPPNLFQYKLLATTLTSTMQKELTQAAKEGYRLLPRTLIGKVDVSLFYESIEIVVVLEKDPASAHHYDYRLLATTLTSTLQKEITQSQEAGYVIAGMFIRTGPIVIMEKESTVSSDKAPRPPSR